VPFSAVVGRLGDNVVGIMMHFWRLFAVLCLSFGSSTATFSAENDEWVSPGRYLSTLGGRIGNGHPEASDLSRMIRRISAIRYA